MGKIKSSVEKKEILLFAIKCVVLNAVFICAFSAFVAFLIYKFDIDLSLQKWVSIAACVTCAFLTAFLSTLKFKNNGFAVGVITYIPLFLFSLINLIIGENTPTVFIVKLALCFLLSGVGGLYSVKRAKKVRLRK